MQGQSGTAGNHQKKVNSLVPEKTGAEIHLKAFYSNVSLWSDVIFFREYNRFLWTM